MTIKGKTYWLVGASEGLGRALANSLDAAGATLVLSARNEDRLNALAAELGPDTRVVPADIADDAAMAKVAETLGDVDGMIFMAGVYWPIKATEWDAEKVTTMADVNFTGAFRVLNCVMPQFLKRDAGHIVMIGSLAGFRGLPGAIGYGASKSAVMHLAENLQIDLKSTGIKVQLANPGFVKTRLTDKNAFDMPFLQTPEQAAQEIVTLMHGNRFRKSFPWLFSLVFRVSKFLPDWLYFRIYG